MSELIASALGEVTRIIELQWLDESHIVLQPIPVTIYRHGEREYYARFDAARIAIGGRTPENAVDCLRDVLAGAFDDMACLPDEELSEDLQKQRDFLKQHISKPDTSPMPMETPEPFVG